MCENKVYIALKIFSSITLQVFALWICKGIFQRDKKAD